MTFDTRYSAARATTYWGDLARRPALQQAQGDPHDIAVVVLDNPVKGITPARLPEADSLWATGGQQFASVGYGAQR